MNALWALFFTVVATVAAAACGAAWANQRRLLAQVQRRLHESERSNADLTEQLRTLRLNPDSTYPVAGSSDDVSERRQALERALDPPPPPGTFPWLETLPAGEGAESHFEATQPDHLAVSLDLNLEDTARR